jgi:prepilin-type N-terminal cleavage/methylation domain-containing protein/prepilin-type processing-associated H-X9-DG protein
MGALMGPSSMRPSAGTPFGFTLIELLVVIAIIALLATLGTAAWQRSQRYTRAAACMQNLRQIGTGLARYVGEHDGVFPELAMARASKNDNVPVIDTELRAYVPDARTFACPDDSKHLAQTTGTSYLWNTKLNGQRLASLSVSFLAMNPIDDPSRIMVMGDKEGFHPNLDNKLNVLYADGHASQELTFVEDAPQK